jgi:hypothetical protein
MDLGHVHLVGFLRLLRASDGWLRPPTLPGCSVASEGDSRGSSTRASGAREFMARVPPAETSPSPGPFLR